jgi:uncharacterized protein (TIGR03546 family)
MTLILKQLFQFFKLLNSDGGLYQLSLGLACGVVLGFAPLFSLQSLLIIICCFFFRIQLGAAFLSAFFFKFVAFLVDPAADLLGRYILEAESLRPLFLTLYNAPIIPFTRFNNSIVMGSAAISFVLVIPLFFLFKFLISKYREKVVAKYKESKIWKAWIGTSFYKWYAKYSDLYG